MRSVCRDFLFLSVFMRTNQFVQRLKDVIISFPVSVANGRYVETQISRSNDALTMTPV